MLDAATTAAHANYLSKTHIHAYHNTLSKKENE